MDFAEVVALAQHVTSSTRLIQSQMLSRRVQNVGVPKHPNSPQRPHGPPLCHHYPSQTVMSMVGKVLVQAKQDGDVSNKPQAMSLPLQRSASQREPLTRYRTTMKRMMRTKPCLKKTRRILHRTTGRKHMLKTTGLPSMSFSITASRRVLTRKPRMSTVNDFEFYIKWQDKSHYHATWENNESMSNFRSTRRVDNYVRKVLSEEIRLRHGVDAPPEDREKWNLDRERDVEAIEDYKMVERVIGVREAKMAPPNTSSNGNASYTTHVHGSPKT